MFVQKTRPFWMTAPLAAILAAACNPLHAQVIEDVKQLEGVGVTERLDTTLPLDLAFVNEKGQPVKLGDYFNGDRPVVLTLNYSDCPMLCSLQLNGLFECLAEMDLDLGEDYEMVTVSIDPSELPERAYLTKTKYLKIYGRGGAEGYHCLTGEQEQISQVADAVGYGYRLNTQTGEYLHVAVTMIVTPDGKMSRYLYGVEYDPKTMELSLLEAGEGKIGTPMDQIILYCFHYDETTGKYGPAAFRIMQIGGIGTVIVLGIILLGYWRRESRRAHAVRQTAASPSA